MTYHIGNPGTDYSTTAAVEVPSGFITLVTQHRLAVHPKPQ